MFMVFLHIAYGMNKVQYSVVLISNTCAYKLSILHATSYAEMECDIHIHMAELSDSACVTIINY